MVKKAKNFSLNAFLKELKLTIKFSLKVERLNHFLSEEKWKHAVDVYIYGVRRYLIIDKTNTLEVYSKYGLLSNKYQFRKHSFLHWGFLKGKVSNVSEFDSSNFIHRVLNCRRLHDAIQEDIAQFITVNPNVTEEDIKTRKKFIEQDIASNLDLLSTHFEKFSMMGLALASHYMFRRMFEGVAFQLPARSFLTTTSSNSSETTTTEKAP